MGPGRDTGRGGKRGFTILEVGLAAFLAGLAVALALWALRTGPMRAQTGGAARVVASFLEQAGAQARARGVPVGVAIARTAQPTALLLVAGASQPVIEAKLDLAADFPQTVLGFGAGEDSPIADLGLSAAPFDMARWSEPFPSESYRLLVFLPSGEVVAQGLPLYQGGYSLLLSAGSEVGSAPDFVPTRVALPQTVRVGQLGQVESYAGAGLAFGSPIEALSTLEVAAQSSADLPASPPKEVPELTGVDIFPDPLRVARAPNIDAVVEPSGYLTLVAKARSPKDIPLYCQWTDPQQGRVSSATAERMTYDAAQKLWVSRWHWRAPDAAMSEYVVNCNVTDEYGRPAADSIFASLNFQVSPAKQKVVYSSNRLGAVRTLFSVYEDGAGEHQILQTPPGGFDGIAGWSPDGARLMLMSNRSGRDEVWVANADGSDPRQITNLSPGKGSPEWSSDGTRICFIYPTTSERAARDIWVMNADGSDQHKVTDTYGTAESLGALQGDGYLPSAWSPNDKYIAYEVNGSIWTVDTDPPYHSRKVSGALPGCSRASWSPVFGFLYFISSRDVYRLQIDESDWAAHAPVALTSGGDVRAGQSAQVSPNGQRLVYSSYGGLMTVPAGGGSPQPLTSDSTDNCPSWLDDETVSFVRGSNDIYTVSLTGADTKNISKSGAGLVFFLGWTPDLVAP